LSRWSSVLWPPPTSHPAFPWISLLQLISAITMDVDHRPNETSPVPPSTFTTSRSPYAGEACPELVEGFFGAAFPGSSRLPWPSLSLTSLALPGSPSGANLSTLQDSLYVAGCGFALLSQEVTTLQHHRSPDSTGCLLRGCLTITATGLSPVSRRQLSGHTSEWLCGHLPDKLTIGPLCLIDKRITYELQTKSVQDRRGEMRVNVWPSREILAEDVVYDAAQILLHIP